MKDNLTEVIVLCDDNVPVADFSETVKVVKAKLKAANSEREIRLSLYEFGAERKKLFENIPITQLTAKKLFSPHKSHEVTLIDSAMELAHETGVRYSNTPVEEIPSRIVFLIITFGKDNASKKYTYDNLREMIEHQSYVYKWEFFILTDSSFVVEKLGLPEQNVVYSYTDTEGFFPSAMGELVVRILR
ncbi:MAG: hypothetical protein FWD34_10020 [Oscillospiraceae bacterium]|nr:hypothetical protein [Oscillospiraceae bacterium]